LALPEKPGDLEEKLSELQLITNCGCGNAIWRRGTRPLVAKPTIAAIIHIIEKKSICGTTTYARARTGQ
jgi:hypothetical protein